MKEKSSLDRSLEKKAGGRPKHRSRAQKEGKKGGASSDCACIRKMLRVSSLRGEEGKEDPFIRGRKRGVSQLCGEWKGRHRNAAILEGGEGEKKGVEPAKAPRLRIDRETKKKEMSA